MELIRQDYSHFTHAYEIDGAKNEGNHWTNEADVLASGRYKVYAGRSGANWIEDYVFPYSEEWYSDRYIIEDDGVYIECCPRPL